MVHLPEVDRGCCEFPNVHAVVLSFGEQVWNVQAGYSARGTDKALGIHSLSHSVYFDMA